MGCSAFARRYLRNRIRFLFLRLLRCFTSAGVALPGLFNSSRSHWVHQWGFPIRRSSGQRLLPSHRGLSQVTASFIASQHQGIHLVPLVAYLNVSTYHSIYTIGAEQSCMAFFPCRVVKERPPLPAGGGKIRVSFRRVVGQAGLEPATPRLSSACSNQLSYRPCLHRSGCGLVELRRFELLTSCLQSRRSTN